MCFDNDHYCDFYRAKFVVARKPHRCGTYGCKHTIQRGDVYEASSGKSNDTGEMFSGCYCGACLLTIYRIHLHEVHDEGCGWYESWCQPADLIDYCLDADFEMSTYAEGQIYAAWKRESERLRKPPKKRVA